MSFSVYMKLAIEQARLAIAAGQSPFGSVIVRDNALVAAAHNEVWKTTDPTAHAEVVCIRKASAALKTIDLSGCVLFSTCEPCPMCASAIHWAKLDAVYFGATIADAAAAGFTELAVPIGELYARGGAKTCAHAGLLQAECAALFQDWLRHPDHRPY